MPSRLNRPKASDAWRWLALSMVPLAAVLMEANAVADLLETKGWTEVQATVVSSTVKASCTKGPQYTASIRLGYSVFGATYTSDSSFFTHMDCASFEEASSIASQYATGSRVTARVNPADHNQSTLAAPAFSLQAKLNLGFFAALFFVCAGLGVRAYRGVA